MAGKSPSRIGRGYQKLRDAYSEVFDIPKTNVDELIRVRVQKDMWDEIEAEKQRRKQSKEAGFFGPF